MQIDSAYIKELTKKYNDDINCEDAFYYVYGILHNKQYRSCYGADLKKELPRIPFVDSYNEFKCFSKLGKQLAKLHLNYESIQPLKSVLVEYSLDKPNDDWSLYKVSKMKFDKDKNKINKSTIIINDYIRVVKIPEKAYEYVVNGRSAIE